MRIFELFPTGDSWEMTRGSGWPIFGVLVIFSLVAIVLQITLVEMTEGLTAAGSIWSNGVEAIVDAVFSIFFIALAVAAYRLLNPNHNRLEAVFE